jgi:hypothetical protein
MSVELHKTWAEVRVQIDNMISELQDWRDYEEEVGHDLEHTDLLSDAIDSLLALMPTNVEVK